MNVLRWVLVICAIGGGAWSDEKAAGPRFEMESRAVELPDHLWSEPLVHTFEFYNSGMGDLRVSVEKTSCGCTAAVVSDAAVTAGSSGCVQLTYTPNEKEKRLGVRTYSASLKINDAKLPHVALEMKCRLTEAVAATPESLEFDKEAVLPLTVTCHHWNGPRKVLSIASSSPAVSLRALPVEEAEGELSRYRYEVTFSGADAGKTLRTAIVVRTDSPEMPVLEIPVRAEPPSRLSMKPEKLLFGAVRPGTAVARTVTLTPKDPLCVPARVASEDPRIGVVLEPMPDGGAYRLTATLEAAAAIEDMETLKSSVEVLDDEGRTVGNVGVFALLMPSK